MRKPVKEKSKWSWYCWELSTTELGGHRGSVSLDGTWSFDHLWSQWRHPGRLSASARNSKYQTLYPKTTHNSLRTIIFWLASQFWCESQLWITILIRQLSTTSCLFFFISPWIFCFTGLLFQAYLNLCLNS